jgi:hypothetical protein
MWVDSLIATLDSVHVAILVGQIQNLDNLTHKIGMESDDLSSATPQQLHDVRNKAARNALCLQAAMKGIRAAQRRLAELRQAQVGHVTYDQHGQRATLGALPGSVRQRI